MLKGGGIEVERPCGRHIRHCVVATCVLRILEYRVGLTEDNGGDHKACLRGLLCHIINIVLHGSEAVLLSTVRITGTFSRDVVVENHVHCYAAYIHLLAVTEIEVCITGSETFFVPQRNSIW